VRSSTTVQATIGGVPISDQERPLRENGTIFEVEERTRGRMFGGLTINRSATYERLYSRLRQAVNGHKDHRVQGASEPTVVVYHSK
jgi:hypothetical protein